ncbi:MAG: tRNA pseudouridine(38-40) synthase TruA [Candidatus Omnitrophica bacterium]|nr:tRNA pseudouridine(38-40) synthase TruA [Candidatus Omnitrophota bacterium]
MLKNICIQLQYDGANYRGWQIQPKKRRLKTVQQEVEKAIKRLFRKRVRIVSSGRTDKAVHANCQYANFKIDTSIQKKNIKRALNSYLPNDIYIRKISFVSSDFHSRFSAKSKTYRYMILNKGQPDVFSRNYSWWIPRYINLTRMRKASRNFLGRKNLSTFAQKAEYSSCIREIKKISIRKKNDFICIDIKANGFLRGMARNIVSFLVDIGLGKVDIGQAKKAILSKDRSFIGKPAPAYGLYLWKVYY